MNYVDNEKLLQSLISHRQACTKAKEEKQEEPRMPDYVGMSIMLIAENMSRVGKFVNYSYRDEMIGDAIENCTKYYKNFNPEITKNPFAYFSQICYYAFIRRIGKEKVEQYVKYKHFQQHENSMNDMANEMDDDNVVPMQMYDNISEFIETFEKSDTAKRAKKKKVKVAKKGVEHFLD